MKVEPATAHQAQPPRAALCVETQGRNIMAVLVNEIVADAMRLDLMGPQNEAALAEHGQRPSEVPDRG